MTHKSIRRIRPCPNSTAFAPDHIKSRLALFWLNQANKSSKQILNVLCFRCLSQVGGVLKRWGNKCINSVLCILRIGNCWPSVPSFDASMSKNTIHINKIRYFTSRPLVELTQTKQWDKENRRYGGWRHEFSFQDTERAAKKETRTWLRGPRKWWLSG